MREKKLPELSSITDMELLKLLESARDSLSVRDFMELSKEKAKRGLFKEEKE